MTKAIVFLLDKFVWMLLITVIATQALQFAGVVPTPKGLEEISYEKDNNYEFQLGIGDSGPRGKRQTDGAGNIIDNIFNIPIATLNAVSELIRNTRARRLQRIQERAELEKAVDTDKKRIQRASPDHPLASLDAHLDESSAKVLLNL
ncbi:uncharacterized protein LOC108744780 isoform X1 [Agrilus planipennis]|uniref:Uncharacterized protein LOC108744780 isoform X1 n=1 Tax=Agrilus planipennis TaxID=224129 RepID=A0A1W4XJN5_AGRPL|nr:uncharacterized protein LOC108744780 isoform X1 [Agrilus planipennis]